MYVDLEGQIETVNIRLDPESAKLLQNLFGRLSLNDIKKLMGKSKTEIATQTAWLTNDLYKDLCHAFNIITEVEKNG